MIQSTKGKLIQDILASRAGKGFPVGITKAARRKLTMLDAARELEDLRGDRKGQHAIRVNDRWRFCFVWTERGPAEVEFTDYH